MQDKRQGFADCFTISNMLRAADECYKGVGWKRQPQLFMNRALTNCAKLLREVEDGTYRPTATRPFTISERGKTRRVKPVNFRDRVVQRCFCENVLVPAVESSVSAECSAVLPCRGLTYAFERVRKHAVACPVDGWVVQFDFSGYFASIDQTILLSMLCRLLSDERLYRFCETVIRAESPGLELGSHVSQLCATALPVPLDSAVMALDGVTGYHRYMDDGIAFCRDRETAIAAMDTIERCSSELHLSLNAKKTHINRATHPFVFCKLRFTKDARDGSVRVNVRKKQSRHAVKHAKSVKRRSEMVEGIDILPVRAALEGYLDRGDADLSRLSLGIFD